MCSLNSLQNARLGPGSEEGPRLLSQWHTYTPRLRCFINLNLWNFSGIDLIPFSLLTNSSYSTQALKWKIAPHCKCANMHKCTLNFWRQHIPSSRYHSLSTAHCQMLSALSRKWHCTKPISWHWADQLRVGIDYRKCFGCFDYRKNPGQWCVI